MKKVAKRCLLLLGCLLSGTQLWAADAVADTSHVVDLDQVIVVAQPKESFRLRQQPVASNVFTTSELTQRHVSDLSSLSAYVPSLVMPQYGSRLTSSIYIRGIGSRINNPAVGIYYDNIPLLGKSAYNTHFYQLDRVDVLRGAQGTLYGVNTEGGLVRIYSKNPMSYQGTDIRMGLQNGLGGTVELAHFHRPSDNFAFSAAAFYNGQHGFFTNQNLQQPADLLNEAGGKMRFMWTPTSRLTFDLTSDYQFTRQNAFPYGLYDVDNDRVGQPSTTRMNGYKRNMVNTGLSISYEGKNLMLSSITSYQFLQDYMRMDQDYLPQDYMSLSQKQKQQGLTQELTLRTHGDRRWQWTTGAFGSYQWLRTDAPVNFGAEMTAPIGNAVKMEMENAMVQSMIGRGMPEAAARAQVARMGVSMEAEMGVPEVFHTPQMNVGLYHESNIRLADPLTLTLGLRYDYSRVKIDYNSLAYMAMTGGVGQQIATYTLTSHLVNNDSKSYQQLLPKVGLTWRVADNGSNVYALVSKGFRAGGYNIQMFSDILQVDLMANRQQAMRGDYDVEHDADAYDRVNKTISYKPEVSWNYEVGAHLNLFGGKVHADLATFFMQIRNQQLSVMASDYGFGRMMVNAGRSNSCGAEVALRGSAADNRFQWGATYSFTHADFRDYTDGEGDDAVSYKGKLVPFVPQHAFSVTADYRFPLSSNMPLQAIVVGVNGTGNGKIYWDEANTYKQPFYALLGAHVDLDCQWAVLSFWGSNLTSTKYNTFAVRSSATREQLTFAQRGLPLQFGFDLRLHI